jgi:hypothetical protein
MAKQISSGDTQLLEFDFKKRLSTGLLVCAGGFEHRATAFSRRLDSALCSIEDTILFRYESQREDNDPHYNFLRTRLLRIAGTEPHAVSVNADTPIRSCARIRERIESISAGLEERTALIDISGMTHLWALATVDACLSCGLRTSVVFTEARYYFPSETETRKVVRAWRTLNYREAADYLQSKGLKDVHILPEFGGNFRPGRQTCLMIFVGYEPNRVQGLVDAYAPGALIVVYGKSPHRELLWRADLSRDLHRDLFSSWLTREIETSTLQVDDILSTLEKEFEIIRDQFDVAISPQCSKMQALASYLFWRRHPEVQLLFTSPVTFNPRRYSWGSRRTFIYGLGL